MRVTDATAHRPRAGGTGLKGRALHDRRGIIGTPSAGGWGSGGGRGALGGRTHCVGDIRSRHRTTRLQSLQRATQLEDHELRSTYRRGWVDTGILRVGDSERPETRRSLRLICQCRRDWGTRSHSVAISSAASGTGSASTCSSLSRWLCQWQTGSLAFVTPSQ